MIFDRFDMREGTIYRWLTAIEERPLGKAIYDKTRPGRPSNLSQDRREAFKKILHEPPTETDIDAPAWTPKLARKYLREEFDVDYSLPHVR